VTAERIAQALTRTLTAHFKLGWFDTLAARAQVGRWVVVPQGQRRCHAPPLLLPPLLLHWQGLVDPVPYNDVTMANVSSPEHRALSGRAAREALVLLKNGGGEGSHVWCKTP